MFGRRLSLVQPGQAAVVALIEAPGPLNGNPHLVNAVQNKPQGADGPLQDGRVANIKLIAGICWGGGAGNQNKTSYFKLRCKNTGRF